MEHPARHSARPALPGAAACRGQDRALHGGSNLRRPARHAQGVANRRSLFVPEGIAQGYQTLVDDTEVYYQMTIRYHPEAARGVRWDDPMLAIDWPLPTIAVVSDADRAQPIFAAATGG